MQNPKLVKYDRLSPIDSPTRRIGISELAEFELVFQTYWAPILRTLHRLLGDFRGGAGSGVGDFFALAGSPPIAGKGFALTGLVISSRAEYGIQRAAVPSAPIEI